MTTPPEDERDARLDDAVRDYLEKEEEGTPPERRAWLAEHAADAVALDEFLLAHETVESLTGPLRAASGDPNATISHPPVATPAALVQGFGNYEDLREIGRGGMGVVYRAWQKMPGRTVAIKMILAGAQAGPEDLTRFEREARTIGALDHPNIIKIYDFGTHEEMPYFPLEFVAGGSLRDKLVSKDEREAAPWANGRAATLIQTLAQAIDVVHNKGIVHRDLKPGNILLTPDGVPKITDFGLALCLDEAKTASNILGTAAYMAPEQANPKSGPVDRRADVYALGAMLYELLTGRPPFTGATVLDVLDQVLNAEPVSPRVLNPKVDRDLETICLKCLEKQPARRYPTALALAEDLGRYLRREPILARPIGRVERTWRWCRRHPSRAVAAALFLVAGATVFTVVLAFNQRLQRERRELQAALTEQVAERLDRQLQEMAERPDTIAAALALRDDWSDAQLETWMRTLLEGDPRGYGITVAFDPELERGDPIYVYRDLKDGGNIKSKRLTKANYEPFYTEWRWYSVPVKTKKPAWSDPFYDQGGGDIVMVSYSVPVVRGADVRAVLTIDVPWEFFQSVRELLDQTKLADGYGFLLGRDGVFLSHPNPEWSMPKTHVPKSKDDKYVPKKMKDTAAFNDLAPRLEAALREKERSFRAIDPYTGKRSRFLLAPVATPGWLLVTVVEE
ncbi:MAG: protein kinase [Gemmataceae bacterium]